MFESTLVKGACFVLCFYLACLLLLAYMNRGDNGIVENHDRTAVYLDGEACVVNYDEDREVFVANLMWCADMWHSH